VKLFLDTGAFVARALKDDRYHAAAIDAFDGISKGRYPFRLLFTSNYVVDETVTFLLYEAGARVAVSVLELIRGSPSLRMLHVSEEIEGEADAAFRRYASSRVSYTDCTSQILMQREGIDTAFSFDRDLETLGFRRIP
jgi:predicted nucleic acid-binding protein